MEPGAIVYGDIVDYEDPDRAALAGVMEEALMAGFMWMHAVETDDGNRIDAYKHSWTRRYLHLDGTGGAYAYASDDRYVRIPLAMALDEAFPAHARDDLTRAELIALTAAVARARGEAMGA